MASLPLTTDQRNHLVRLLAQNRYCLTPGGRELILDETGLATYRTALNLATDARQFANELVRLLHEAGTPPGSAEPALVPLLRWLRGEVEGHERERVFVDTLLALPPREEAGPSAASLSLIHI